MLAISSAFERTLIYLSYCTAELGEQCRLLLKQAGKHSRINISSSKSEHTAETGSNNKDI